MIRPGTRGPIPIAPADRLEKFLEKTDTCWIFHGQRDKKGYGRIIVGSAADGTRKLMLAHQLAYILAYGPLPEDKPFVLHSCDNPPCCNPEHLRAGTIAENNAEMAAKKRAARGEKHHWAKLTEQQVSEIRVSPLPRWHLAEDYGVSEKTIWRIRNGRSWT